jgi:hypothetical protein
MTPLEYLQIESEQQEIIKAAQKKINDAREIAGECPPPVKRRKAEAGDIQPGAIIWHARDEDYGGDYWHIVMVPRRYGDPQKAYVADNGSRYGLEGAYVEVEQEQGA